MAEQSLVLIEAAEEQRYLFDAPALADVRGAAAVLESLARFTVPSLARRREFGGAGIIAGGSRYLATFPSAEIGVRFVREARRVYQQRAGDVSLHASVQEVSAEDLVLRFGRRFRAIRQAGEQEGQRISAYSPELRLCDTCRRLPATRSAGPDLVCRACANRRTAISDQDARLAIPGYQTSLADAGDEDLAERPAWERLLRWLRDIGAQRSADAGQDISGLAARRLPDVATLADAERHFAVLVVTIPEFLEFTAQVADSQRALRAAARLNRLLDESLFDALTPLVRSDGQAPFRFEALLAGGDRLVCLLPGDVAHAIAARILRTIEGQSAAVTEGRRFSAHAGLAIVPSGVAVGAAATLAGRAAERAVGDTHAAPRQFRGAWRSTITVETVSPSGETTLTLGEFERALTHARSLRRNGLRSERLRLAIPALDRSDGRAAWLTATWTEPQRRAFAAIARDLAIGGGETSPEIRARLWPAIAHALAFVAPDSLAFSTRPTVEAATGTASAERSA